MKIIHLSDLHFGTLLPNICDQLEDTLSDLNPDVIIISGDFTQVASTQEFKTAQDFISRLPVHTLCVPGNHDVPRYDLMERFFDPWKKFKKYIQEDLCPVFENDEVIIVGLNSARRMLPHWNWANGAISGEQLEFLKETYAKSPAKQRICFFHHPVHTALTDAMDTVVFGGKAAMRMMNELNVDLVLTGHVHHASITTMGDIKHKTVYLSSSTTLSSRLREQENGFNVIEMDQMGMTITVYTYQHGFFAPGESYAHVLQA